ncbi:hypothetical protein HPP92_016153 [Vanilla planifolia]|uniref:Serine/threonine-protein kinase 11-interacting protein n=1 Tax=Vanilla planifolia TaxID=51239 RepID=A0A835URS9_VANPL|nr:hypothetical protein HPP92_016153 [Vanilla planifolia]
MAVVTGDRYLEYLVRFVERNAGTLLDGTLTLKLNPVGLHYVQSRLDALQELEGFLTGAPVDYLRAYVSDLGDHRALEQLRRILGLLTMLKVISVLPSPGRDPTPISLQAFSRLKFLELRGCDLSTSSPQGLLELRHTLEKLICHNSTDALRHVFASRIADVKDSPTWSRLTFVSCALNSLVLMDESLQLLPAVETLDLSRNQFAKVDNLCKGSKLQHLDLGFNHLRSIASLNEVSCPIVKLVLRNNALTTLRGLEHLKSIEGLDISYNLISSFSEMEILASLPRLQSLWLEGNPICCTRWYRAHVFSFFSSPEKLVLDDSNISTKEYWERHIIFTSKQKQPPAYGFYFPANDRTIESSSPHAPKKKCCRLANIVNDEQKYLGMEAFEQDSLSYDDMSNKDENTIPDDDSKIIGLMNKVEHMKKERSILWLRDFKDWMAQKSEVEIDQKNGMGLSLNILTDQYEKKIEDIKHDAESSWFANYMTQETDGVDSSKPFKFSTSLNGRFSCDNGNLVIDGRDVMEPSVVTDGQYFATGLRSPEVSSEDEQTTDDCKNPHNLSQLFTGVKPVINYSIVAGGSCSEQKNGSAPLSAIDEFIGSQSSSTYPGSPPHYQKDILHRRLYLEEEFLQPSAESISVESLESETSCSDDESCGFNMSIGENDSLCSQESHLLPVKHTTGPLNNHGNGHEDYHMENTASSLEPDVKLFISRGEDAPSINNKHGNTTSSCASPLLSQDVGGIERVNCEQQLNMGFMCHFGRLMAFNTEPECKKVSGNTESCKADKMDVLVQSSYFQNRCNILETNEKVLQMKYGAQGASEQDEYIKDLFTIAVVDTEASETCQEVVFCGCIYQHGSLFIESEAALLKSCNNKLYLQLIDGTKDGLGNVWRILGCYRLDEIREVVTGLGMQAMRINMEDGVTYVFVTRAVEVSRYLLGLLNIFGSSVSTVRCSLQSWEHIQVELLEKCICRSLKSGIYFYSMVLFWQDKCEGKSWLSRSLFVIEGLIVVCFENLVQFGSSRDDLGSLPYYHFDTHCLIQNILELVKFCSVIPHSCFLDL